MSLFYHQKLLLTSSLGIPWKRWLKKYKCDPPKYKILPVEPSVRSCLMDSSMPSVGRYTAI